VGRLTQIGMPSSRQGNALHGKSGNTPRHIVRLQFFTLAWMLVECGVAYSQHGRLTARHS
jgi:hypothetical protein